MKPVTVQEIHDQVRAKKLSHDEIVQRANHHLNNNELDQAYPYADYLAKHEECSSSTIMTTGMIALLLNKKNEAKDCFESVLHIEPDNYDAAYNTALIDIEENKLLDALETLRRLVLRYPGNAGLLNDLAVVLSNLHETEEAFTYWRKSLSTDPNNSTARNNALEYTLETGLFERGKEILFLNQKNKKISAKTALEINHWLEIIEKRSTREK